MALFERDRLGAGEEGWAQLRLEEPVLARARDHLVFRSYSPVTTLGGGRVVEVLPRKRRRMAPGEDQRLRARLDDSPETALSGLLEMAEWTGVSVSSLPHRTGFSPPRLKEAIAGLQVSQALVQVEDRLLSGGIWREGEGRVLSALEKFHEENPLKPGIPLEELRQVLPGDFGPKLAEAVLQKLASVDRLSLRKGTAALADFRPSLSNRQTSIRTRLKGLLVDAGLTPPNTREMGASLGDEREIEEILRLMEEDGEVVNLDGEFFFDGQAVWEAGRAVVKGLGGSEELGPADFREVLPISRRHLLPLLRYFDLRGVTTRMGDGRSVAQEIPEGWGTIRDRGR